MVDEHSRKALDVTLMKLLEQPSEPPERQNKKENFSIIYTYIYIKIQRYLLIIQTIYMWVVFRLRWNESNHSLRVTTLVVIRSPRARWWSRLWRRVAAEGEAFGSPRRCCRSPVVPPPRKSGRTSHRTGRCSKHCLGPRRADSPGPHPIRCTPCSDTPGCCSSPGPAPRTGPLLRKRGRQDASQGAGTPGVGYSPLLG